MTTAAPPEVILPYPHTGQRAVRQQAKRFNWLAAGRRWRKTTLTMAIAVEAALQGRQIVWGAPVYDQVYVGWEETKKAAGAIAQFNQSRMQAVFPGRGSIIYRSLDDPDNARSHTADGIVIDECGDVAQEAWYAVLRPMLIDTGGWFWGIGTPRGLNWFWREHQRAQVADDSMSWQVPTVGAVIQDGRLVRLPHPLENPNIAFSEIESLFHTSPEADFRQEILAEFVEAGYTIFSPTWWEGALSRFMAADQPLRNKVIGRYLSFDTGLKDRKTSDYTACTVGELTADYRLLVRRVWRDKLTFPNLVGQIEKMAGEFNRDEKLRAVIIEDRVSGTSAYQTLSEASPDGWLARLLVPFNPTGSKAQRASQAGVWCRNGCVWLPYPSDDVPWLSQFEEELFSFSPIESKNEHDDQVDSFSQLIIYLEHYLSEGFHSRRATALAEAGLPPEGARP